MFNSLPDQIFYTAQKDKMIIFYRAQRDKMIMFPIFFIVYFKSLSLFIFIIKCGFIGFFVVWVVLYNVYLDMLVTSISKSIHNLLVSICHIWLYVKKIYHVIVDIWRNKTIPRLDWKKIRWLVLVIIVRILYKKLLIIILYINCTGWLYMFLVYIAAGASFNYLYYIFMQIKDNNNNVDFSLTNAYMRRTYTLDKFIFSSCLYFIFRFLLHILMYLF